MSSIKTIVKWGKETIELDLIPSDGVKALKVQLEEKTGVPVDRMKLMPKTKGLWKGILKDDFDLTSIQYQKVKTPIQILLMGSASKLAGPKTKITFIENLPPEEAAMVAAEPAGLVNLGNTCYLNSVVQCLGAIPQLRTGLNKFATMSSSSSSSSNSSHRMLLSTLRDSYNSLERTKDAFNPTPFVMATKLAFPQFAQTGPGGRPMQQDAEEFYSGLLNIVAMETQNKALIQSAFGKDGEGGDAVDVSDEALNGASNLIDAMFGIKMEETLTCDELGGGGEGTDSMEVDGAVAATLEPSNVRYDLHRKLVCNIQGGSDAKSQVNVTHIMEGISLSLTDKVEKRSETLGRDAVYTRKQRIARLPPILVVQFGRFFWKETPDSQDHAGVKCKVMKPVAFQGTLDVYEFCSEKIQKVLKTARDKALAEEDEKIAKKLNGGEEEKEKKEDGDATMEDTAAVKTDQDEGMDEDDDDDLKAALAMSVAAEEAEEPSIIGPVGPGLPKEFQGQYELFAIVTHKGRDADGGHYMGWVKAEKQGKAQKIADTEEENEDWFVFDDDEVSPCKTDTVLELKGGGDYHMSYLNFYRAKK